MKKEIVNVGQKKAFKAKSTTIYLIIVLEWFLIFNVNILCAADSELENNTQLDNIAATVNGVPIDISVIHPQVEDSLHKYKKYGLRKSDIALEKYVKLQALESLIATELIYQEAKKLNVKNLDERIEKSLNQLEDSKKESDNYDEQKLRQLITKKIIINEYLLKNKLLGYNVPDEEVLAYYKKNKESFAQGEMIRSRHILVGIERDVGPEDKDEAYKRIIEAKKSLQGGEKFEDVAKQYSDCNSASSGGDLGYHQKGYMPKTYDDIAFSLEKGQLSDVIESQHGYHIIEVLDKKSKGIQPYEEVKDFISRFLNIEYQKNAMKDHISTLKEKANIEIYL